MTETDSLQASPAQGGDVAMLGETARNFNCGMRGRRVRIAAAYAAVCALAMVAPATGGQAQIAPVQPQGAKLFKNQCASCHSTVADETRVGPSLHGIMGRKAAALADYPYSDVLRQRGAEGLVWTAENLDPWLENSGAFVPGNMMDFHLADPQKRAAIVTYLSELK